MPYVRVNAPDAAVSTADIREMVRLAGQNPASVPDGATLTWREIYKAEVVGALRSLAKFSDRPPSDDEVAELEALTHRMPAVAIEYLTQAYEGRLLPEDDIAAAAVHIQLASDDHPLLRARVRLLDIIRRVWPILLGLMTASRTRSSVCVGRRTDPSVVEQTTDPVG